MILELNERSRTIFQFIVDSYLETGQPVGSRTVSRQTSVNLSPASIRNTMADLEYAGLLYAPHTSAGRIPTNQGLRLYIDGLMQVGGLSATEQKQINAACHTAGRTMDEVLSQAVGRLSGLSSCASLVIAPKTKSAVKQVQFVQLSPRKVLTILVLQNGLVENRILEMEEDMPSSALMSASNYLNARLAGRTIAEAEVDILEEIQQNKAHLDKITKRLVKKAWLFQQMIVVIQGASLYAANHSC